MTITQDALDDATRLLRGHGYTLRAPTVTSFASAEVFRLICQRCDTHFHARAIANECPPCAAATEEHGLQPVGDVSGSMKKAKVQINYKSGISMVMECDEFSIKGGVTFEWSGGNPRPLLLGADDIESVWALS